MPAKKHPDALVAEIRARYRTRVTIASLAAEYRMSRAVVKHILFNPEYRPTRQETQRTITDEEFERLLQTEKPMHLRYDCYGAYVAGEQQHPQIVMRELGITYQQSTPQSMGDQWWFWNCRNVPSPLPPYLSELTLNPQEQVGYGLSQEDADAIEKGAG